jgi:hypothetical protein
MLPVVDTPPPNDPELPLALVKSRFTAKAGVAVGDDVTLGVKLAERVGDRLEVTDDVEDSVDVWLGETDSLGVEDGDENALREEVGLVDHELVTDSDGDNVLDRVDDNDTLEVGDPVTDTDKLGEEERDGDRVPVEDLLADFV